MSLTIAACCLHFHTAMTWLRRQICPHASYIDVIKLRSVREISQIYENRSSLKIWLSADADLRPIDQIIPIVNQWFPLANLLTNSIVSPVDNAGAISWLVPEVSLQNANSLWVAGGRCGLLAAGQSWGGRGELRGVSEATGRHHGHWTGVSGCSWGAGFIVTSTWKPDQPYSQGAAST